MSQRLLFILLTFFFIFTKYSFAADFDTATVRLDRQAVSASTGGLVCITTPSTDNGVETSFQIVFPNSFTVNSSASNWTVSTNDTPQGATAWPGIATATNVTGKTVTFPSSDLSASTQYCFSFATVLTNPSSEGNYQATIRTRNGATSIIDSQNVGLGITTNDSISVSATVPASPQDFTSNLYLTSHSSSELIRENTTLSYTLEYGSALSYPATLVVEAQWSLGTIQGASSATEDLLEYDIGSATSGYNNTTPVIDITNRKITWTITNFPGTTNNQTVKFRLKTRNAFTTSSKIDFVVSGRVVSTGSQTADSDVNSTYLYSSYITPTPGPTSVPKKTTPTPTPSSQENDKPSIQDIDIRTVSASQAAIFVQSSKNVTVKVFYGPTPDSLTLFESSQTLNTQHVITIRNLNPNTQYYFRVVIIDVTGKQASSDVYLVKTSTKDTAPQARIDTLIISSGDTLLTDTLDLKGKIPTIVIPFNTVYSFRFAMSDPEHIKSIKAILRNNNVLGISTEKAYATTDTLTITEISPGQYIGKLSSSASAGQYKLILQIQDYFGNISEQTISEFMVVSPLKVVNSLTKTGIENVKVTLFYYNARLKKYEELPPISTSIRNPSRSDQNGVVDVVLPPGKYKLNAEVLGFKVKSLNFEIGAKASNYPTVELFPLPFSITTYFSYMAATGLDAINLLQEVVHVLRTSIRFFDFIAFGTVIVFIALSILQLARRLCVPVHHLPYFIFYHLASSISHSDQSHSIRGKVVSLENGDGVGGVLLYLSQPKGKVLSHAVTNIEGEFFSKISNIQNLRLTVSKKGYRSYSSTIPNKKMKDSLRIVLSPTQKPSKISLGRIYWYAETVVGSLFEAILVATLFAELIFALEYGVLRVLPFLIISSLNIVLWAAVSRKN